MSDSSTIALVNGVDVDAVAVAVRGCAAVDDLFSTPAALVASYLPGRMVPGVRVTDDAVIVQVRGRWGVPVPDLARQIRESVGPLAIDRRVEIMVADIADPPDHTPPALAAGANPSEGHPWTTTAGVGRPDVSSSPSITPTTVAIQLPSPEV